MGRKDWERNHWGRRAELIWGRGILHPICMFVQLVHHPDLHVTLFSKISKKRLIAGLREFTCIAQKYGAKILIFWILDFSAKTAPDRPQIFTPIGSTSRFLDHHWLLHWLYPLILFASLPHSDWLRIFIDAPDPNLVGID